MASQETRPTTPCSGRAASGAPLTRSLELLYMTGYFEGDLIRPLGLVTLCFGDADAQVNFLLDMLRECGLQ